MQRGRAHGLQQLLNSSQDFVYMDSSTEAVKATK